MRHPRRRGDNPMLPTADFGPSVTRDRKGRLQSTGPGVVSFEDGADPDPGVKHTVRRARRYSVLASLRSEGVVSKRQDDAANRFLDDLCRAQGGSSASFLAIVVSGGAAASHATDGQRKAIRAVQRVRLMLGLNPDTVFWWVVLSNRTPKEFDETHRLRHGTGCGWLKLALDALDEHYNPGGGRSGRASDG